MLIKDIFTGSQEEQKTPFSFEFFPPKNEKGWERLYRTMRDLLPLNPAYVSVTYGAGGSTRENTHNLVTRIQTEGLSVVAHLTCEQSSREEIDAVLHRYNADGVHNILALKGDDPVDGPGKGSFVNERRHSFAYAAELVAHIRIHYPHFGIGVAGFPEGHPATPNRLLEMDYLKAKVEAGADYIVTQLFFDNRDFYDYRERCELAGIHVPIIAGLMPITTVRGMERMAELSRRSRFPSGLIQRLKLSVNNNAGNWDQYARSENNTPAINAAVARVGEHWCSEQISDLLNNHVAGIHLYTLNTSQASIRIMENLGLASYSVKTG